jgi:hypothetical protein
MRMHSSHRAEKAGLLKHSNEKWQGRPRLFCGDCVCSEIEVIADLPHPRMAQIRARIVDAAGP